MGPFSVSHRSPVGAEGQVAAVVYAPDRLDSIEQDPLVRPPVALGQESNDPVALQPGVGVVDVHPGPIGEAWVERDAQQASLASRYDVEMHERLRQQLPVPHDPHVARVLLGEEQPPVGCERHVRGEAKARQIRLGRGRPGGTRRHGRQQGGDHCERRQGGGERQERTAAHLASVDTAVDREVATA